MPEDNIPLLAFNRGVISKLALSRTDIKRTAMSAEEQTNWMPRVLGSAMNRPGLEYVGTGPSNKKAYHVPFVYSRTDKAILEFSDELLRIKINETVISRVSVSTAVTNGDFSSAMGTGWTDNDEVGAAVTISGGKLNLLGTGFNSAITRQTITVAGGDQNKEHALRIVVDRGPVILRVGSSSGGDEYVTETSLGTGVHSITFTPTGASVYLQLSNRRSYTTIVDSCTVEASGEMSLTTPYQEADLKFIRFDQSADVVYIGCAGYHPYKVERRSTNGFSFVKYETEDGPFRTINTTQKRITPSAIRGDITLTASAALFNQNHVGALFRLASAGQEVGISASGEDQWSDSIRVSGVGSARYFGFAITGTWGGTVTIQRSVGEPGSWTDFRTYTANASDATTYDDLDNQIIYYRIGIKSGNYTSGTAVLSLTFASGSVSGIVKITGYTSQTQVSAVVLKDLGGTAAVTNWYEGIMSDVRGYPGVPVLHEGRLWWFGKGWLLGSVSDAFASFDDEVTGDSAPIIRTIGFGPVDVMKFGVGLLRLIIGTDTRELVVRSTSLDEPITVTNFNIKAPSTQGSSDVDGVKIDDYYIFVQGSGNRIFKLEYSGETVQTDYRSGDLTELCPEIGMPYITRIAVQRQPDTRVHCVRSDGKVAVLVSQPAEDVKCWVLVETDGIVEDVVVLPGNLGEAEDLVYYYVKRTINGSDVRLLEKWAFESECVGGLMNKMADSFVTYDGVATATITGLDHLEGESVIVWADGKDMGTATVTSGSITLAETVSKACIGLYYQARFKSAKLAYAAAMSTALNQEKRVDHLGLAMANVHHKGVKYGKSFDAADLDELPGIISDKPVAENTVFDFLDTGMFEFRGDWDVDSRLCILGEAPRPCTLLSVVLGMKTNDG